MAETKSKFAGIFNRKSDQEPPQNRIEEPPQDPFERQPATATRARGAKPIGRPPGKRSDPAWKQYSILLRKETQREAAAILRQQDKGQDFSALVQRLLEGWIKRQHE